MEDNVIIASMSNATYQGAPGHTPQRGVDYWTDEDKEQIIGASIDEIQTVFPFDKLINPEDLSRVATSGDYNDLLNKPILKEKHFFEEMAELTEEEKVFLNSITKTNCNNYEIYLNNIPVVIRFYGTDTTKYEMTMPFYPRTVGNSTQYGICYSCLYEKNNTTSLSPRVVYVSDTLVKLTSKNDQTLKDYITQLETNYATKEYVNSVMPNTTGLKRVIVETLPATDIDENTIYMILKTKAFINDFYDEYMFINNKWELIGSSEVDLSEYSKTGAFANVAFSGDYNDLVNTPEIPVPTTYEAGTGISIVNGVISLSLGNAEEGSF